MICKWCKPPGSGNDSCEVYGRCTGCDGSGEYDEDPFEVKSHPEAQSVAQVITDWPRQVLDLERVEPGQGHGWIQWKGTNVCMDIRCQCGAQGHIDASFAYFYECPSCDATFAIGSTVKLYPVDAEYAAKEKFKPVRPEPEDES